MFSAQRQKLYRALQRGIAHLFQIQDVLARLETVIRLQSYTIDRLNQETSQLRTDLLALQEKVAARDRAGDDGQSS